RWWWCGLLGVGGAAAGAAPASAAAAAGFTPSSGVSEIEIGSSLTIVCSYGSYPGFSIWSFTELTPVKSMGSLIGGAPLSFGPPVFGLHVDEEAPVGLARRRGAPATEKLVAVHLPADRPAAQHHRDCQVDQLGGRLRLERGLVPGAVGLRAGARGSARDRRHA